MSERISLGLLFLLLAYCGGSTGYASNSPGGSSILKISDVCVGARHRVVGGMLLRLRGAGENEVPVRDAGGDAPAAHEMVTNGIGLQEENAEMGVQEEEEEEEGEEDGGVQLRKGEGPKLELLKNLGSKADPRTKRDQDSDTCCLPTMIGNRVIILMTDGRNMAGVLRSFDKQNNLLITNATERVFPTFTIKEEDLNVTLTWPPDTDEDEAKLCAMAGVGNDDEMFLPQPGRILIRGDNVAGVIEIPEEAEEWEKEPFPRVFAYACAREHFAKKTRKFTGND